jgi:hypothetical protein
MAITLQRPTNLDNDVAAEVHGLRGRHWPPIGKNCRQDMQSGACQPRPHYGTSTSQRASDCTHSYFISCPAPPALATIAARLGGRRSSASLTLEHPAVVDLDQRG